MNNFFIFLNIVFFILILSCKQDVDNISKKILPYMDSDYNVAGDLILFTVDDFCNNAWAVNYLIGVYD